MEVVHRTTLSYKDFGNVYKKPSKIIKVLSVCIIANGVEMIEIRYVQLEDSEFWKSLDKHLTDDGFRKKVRDKQGYVLLEDGKPVGLLRFNLFWDDIPFCTLLFVAEAYQGRGYGKALMEHWGADMK